MEMVTNFKFTISHESLLYVGPKIRRHFFRAELYLPYFSYYPN